MNCDSFLFPTHSISSLFLFLPLFFLSLFLSLFFLFLPFSLSLPCAIFGRFTSVVIEESLIHHSFFLLSLRFLFLSLTHSFSLSLSLCSHILIIATTITKCSPNSHIYIFELFFRVVSSILEHIENPRRNSCKRQK